MTDVTKRDTGKSRDPLPPLAIVGIGSIFPKAASADAFWQLVKNGVDAITEVPATHWRPEDYFSEDQKKPDFTYGRRGGFLDPYPFDPLKYGVPPNVLEATDTSQLLGMVVADEAMRDAGYGPGAEFDHDKVSVILGVTGALELVIPLGARLGHPMWRDAMIEAGLAPEQVDDVIRRIGDRYVPWQENSFPGLLGNVVAGRISKYLDTGGTNCVVDAACASSLGALELAALELATGKADMVLTGGVDTFNDIFMYMCFSKTPALSPTGNAKPFDANADGTILGEGIGIVAIKRLEDAERDANRIYAVVRGIGSSSDGKGDAIYAPSSPGQMKALRDAYANARVAPDTIDLLEAHGTGTSRGDAVETEALREVYGELEERAPWCALGSVKSQIGHTKSAAGAAGLIKAALALHHKVLPPTVKVDRPADAVAPDASPFYINTRRRPWLPRPEHPRRAALSAFGFGGSNFHLVLEEYSPKKTSPDWNGATQIFAYSAETKAELAKTISALDAAAAWPSLRDEAFRSREAFNAHDAHRIVFVVEHGRTEFAALVEKIASRLESDTEAAWNLPEGAYYGSGDAGGGLAVVFPGQGAQYPDMLADIACTFPEMLESLAIADDTFGMDARGDRLSDRVYPRSAFDKATDKAHRDALTATDVAQPALGAVSLGAYRVAQRFGLAADAFAGHSYGELVALSAAGVFDAASLATVSKRRGELMGAGDGDRGTMLAVRGPLKQIEKLLDESGLDVVLANRNAPEQAVLSGSTDAIDRAEALFKEHGMAATRLNVAAAFHSDFVADAAKPFSESLAAVSFETSSAPVYANTTAAPYPGDADAARDLLANQLAKPVAFVEQIRRMHDDGMHTFVELGPGARLTGLIAKILDGRAHRAVALDASNGKRDGIVDLARLLAALAAEGRILDLGKWDDDHVVAEVDDSGRPRMTVDLCGANYRAETSKPKPRPPIAAKIETERAAPSRTASAMSPQTPPAPAPPTSAPTLSAPGALGELYRQTQSSLLALQQMQEQTARLHAQYLEGQETATRTFQQLLEQQNRLFENRSGGGDPRSAEVYAPIPQATPIAPATPAADSVVPDPAPTPVASPETETRGTDLTRVLLEVVAEKTGYPVDMLELGMALDADLGIDSIKRVEILSALQEREPALPSLDAEELGSIHTLADIVAKLGETLPAESQATAHAVATGAHLVSMLLEVVAEKTGYPVDMLELDMALDADLGIDSIKRVEILSALQEREPALPSLDAEELGAIHTLRDIVDGLGATSSEATTAAVAPSTVTTSATLEALLLEVVAEKTGYPADMLDLDMALDADLGIDSIKRVEILSALQERDPALPSLDAEELGAIHTLRDVVTALNGAAPPPSTPEPQAIATPIRTTLVRQVLRLEAVAADRASIALGENARLVVTGDAGLGAPLAEALSTRGLQVDYVSLGDAPLISGNIAGLIVIAPTTINDDFSLDAFDAVRALGDRLRSRAANGTALFATVSRMDGGFGFRDRTMMTNPESGALGGLLKTAAHEWPEVSARAFDLAPDFETRDGAAQALANELLLQGPLETGLTPDGSFELALVDAAQEPIALDGAYSSDDVVVITGGARGVTAAVAASMARAGARKLVLIGRSDLPEDEPYWLTGLDDEGAIKKELLDHAEVSMTPQELEKEYRAIAGGREIRGTLAALKRAGAEVAYYAVDVRDAAQVHDAMDRARRRFGAITGIVHGAGVIADRRIEDKTRDQVNAVYATKVAGFRNLLDATPDDPLRQLIVFSSSTARFGRVGQCDYAMANEALNKLSLAEAAQRPACRVVSFNWGPWDGGMVTPALRKVFESEGVGVIDLEAGSAFLLQEMASNADDVEVTVIARPIAESGDSADRPNPREHALNPVLSFDLDVARFPFLESHVLDGKAVLPVSMYVEWMAHAALHAHPGLRFVGLEDLRVLKGVILDNDYAMPLVLAAGDLESSGDTGASVHVELRSADADGVHHLHATATILLDTTFQSATPELAALTPPAYKGFQEEMYNNGVLFHGTAFQGITAVDGCGDEGIVVSANVAPAPGRWIAEPLRHRWIADPLALDCAFQALILWSIDRCSMGSLPVRIGRYEQFQTAFPKAGIRIVARIDKASEHSATAMIEFLHAGDATLVARITEYECVMDASLNESFRRNTLNESTIES